MDEFLERFERRRQARLAAERSFPLAGETLTHKASVAPEVGMRLEAVRREVSEALAEAQRRIAAANGDPPDLAGLFDDTAMIHAADESILACLEPESHDAWARLRDPQAGYPLNFEEIMSLADYLLGRVSGVPTDAPADSSAGRTTTGKGSTGRSSSRAKTRTG